MALFKIFKGSNTARIIDPNNANYITPSTDTDGYAYYDTSTKLFYIDAGYPGVSGISRQPINAAYAGVAGNALNGAFYGTCGTAQSTKAKVAILTDATGFTLTAGTIVVIKFANASADSTMTLTIQDSTGNTVGVAHNLELYGTTAMSSGTTTSGWRAGAVVPFVYDGANWIRFFWENSTYYYTSAYCTTGAATAAKVGAYSGVQTLTGSKYFQIWIQNTNTAASALTLNMNSLGAKKIYLNGEPTSSTNYNLLRGCYLVYYDADGDNGNGCYHFRTDNKIPGNLAGNATSASAVKDYNDSKLTKFGYSTTGMTSTSWLGSWDSSVSGEYRLRAITPANAVKSGIGTTAIGKASLPVYWNGSNFATITSYEGKAATAGVADSANAVAWGNISDKPTTSINWGAGTTAGPTLTVTAAGSSSSAVAIPTASETASGAVTTGNQTFRGRKGFGYMSRYGKNDTGGATQWVADTYLFNGAGTQVGEFWYDIGNATNITRGQYSFRQFSPNSTADTATTGKYETYTLPNVASGLTENKSYSILTSKNAVTIAQGGTGKTTAREGFHALTAGLTEGTADIDDDTVLMSGNTNHATNDWYYRKGVHIYNYIKGKASGDWGINATSAGKWATARTLTIGNKGQSVDGSQNVSWTLHDILNGAQMGTSTTWQQYNPGVYYVASNAAFTGEGNPENANGGLTPYRYGQLIVSRAGNGGVAQFYISHQDSGNSSYGIKYRSGWNNTYNAKWDTLLDSTNYTNYTVTKTGTGASGTWGISITGNAATATKFASNQSVALTGDVTGSASSQAGWSIATTIGTGKVTNAMLAGSIANGKLANSKVTIAGNDVSLGGSLAADTLRSSLGLSNAMHFKGTTTTALTDGTTTAAVTIGGSSYTPEAGDVVLYSDSEFVWTGSAWERLGRDSSFKVTQTAITDSTGTSESTTATRFVYSISQDANGVVSVKTRPLPTYNNYSLPLAASGTRGGIQIGYTESGTNYAVKLSSEKAYVTVPWTDTKVTAVGNHYTPAADTESELTAALSGTAGTYAVDTEYTVLTGIKAQRDAKGHVTGLTYTAQKIKDTNTTYTLPTASSSTLGGIKVNGNGLKVESDILKHSNSVTAKTSFGSTATSASANGGSITVTDVKYDSNGHITGSQDRTITLSQTTYTIAGLMGSTAKGSTTLPIYWSGTAFGTITSYEGNAATATTLATARTINGTSFNGSANITTTKWGTARNISISDSDGTNTGTAVSVNGSAAATLKLPSTIKASLTGAASLNVLKAGDTMTGNLTMSTNTYVQKAGSSVSWYQGRNAAVIKTTSYSGYNSIYSIKTTDGDWSCGVYTGNKLYWTYITDANYNASTNTTTAQMRLEPNGYLYTTRTYGAVWNDYAEYRKDNPNEVQQPGRCVKEIGDGSLTITTKRLERGCEIISDTYGFSIGQDEENGYNTPIASNGRVLAYPYEPIEEFASHIGWAVCSGPNGTVSIMTEEEEERYPSRIIGTISEIPDYEEWGTGKVKVNGRVWIRIK